MATVIVERNPQIKFTQLFINNEWVDSITGQTFETINPSTGETICRIQEGNNKDIDRAVRAANDAFNRKSVWRTIDASMRGQSLWRLADLCQRDLDYICSLETLDSGKPIGESRTECQWAVNMIRYYAGYADKLHGSCIPADGQCMAWTRKEPIGVCGLIVPWNLPFYLMCCKLAPALAAGCTVVVKPAEQTPLTALYLAQLVKEADIPAGVVNVVPGFGQTAGAALAQHMDVRMISFTGSTKVGKLILRASADSNLKRVTLETGGKSPLVVFPDADIELAAKTAHFSVFINSGQACCASTRLYVHESIYDQFVDRCVQLASDRRVGDPFDDRTEQGPVVDDRQMQTVLKYIETGRQEGAKLAVGGKRLDTASGGGGYFIQPTVFTDVTDNMTIAREEIFGPVQCIIKFKEMDDVIDRCNDTAYGLASGVFTQDIDKALSFAQAVRSGNVWINTFIAVAPQLPFGGYNESGLGREAGEDGILEYMETKSIITKVAQKIS